MEVINTDQIASVDMADIRVSADELIVYEAALSYLLDNLSAREIENQTGATRDEIEGIRDDLRDALTSCGTPTSVPVR
jgi:hypothetical protein